MQGNFNVGLRIAMVLILAFAMVVPGHGQESDVDKPDKDVWVEATVMDLRQRRDGETLWLMHTYVAASREEGSTPEKVQAAVERERRRLRPPSGQGDGHTGYKEVLQLIGGVAAMAPLPHAKAAGAIKFAAGVLLGGGVDRAFKSMGDAYRAREWRILREDMDRLYEHRLERQIVSDFEVEMARDDERKAIGVKDVLPPQSSRPDDTVAAVLDRHPEFRQLRLLTQTRDAVKRNSGLVAGVKETLDGFQEEMEDGFQALRQETRDIREQLKTAEQRRIERASEAHALQVKLEGLRGASFVASTVIGWSDPKLGSQVGAVANAGIDVFEAFKKFEKVIANDVGGQLTQFAAAALTGNILAAIIPVLGIFLEPGPSPEAQILEAVHALQEQVETLNKEMHDRFARVDDQLRSIAKRMEKGLDLIVQNQVDMLGRLQDIRMSLQDQQTMSEYILAELRRQEVVLREWLESMHLLPCLIYGETQETMSLDTYQLCRGKIVAIGRDDTLANAQKTAGDVDQRLGDFEQFPDDVALQSLNAFRLATVHEGELLPAKVVGPERLVKVARMADTFLLRWPEYAGEQDLKATSPYALAMQARFAALRAFTEALRNDLFRYANPYADEGGSENAFYKTLESGWQAYQEMRRRVEQEVRADRENHALMIWPHSETRPPRRRSSFYWRDAAAREISDAEVEEIVHAAMKGGRAAGFAGQWDLSHLALFTPPGYGSQDEFLTEVMTEIQDGFEGDEWQFVLMLMRQGLVEAIVEQAYTIHDHPITVADSWQSDTGFRQAVIPWRERPDHDELLKNRDWTSQVVIDREYGMAILLRPTCGRERDKVIISGTEIRRLKLDVTLSGPHHKIQSVRDNWASDLLAFHAAGALASTITRYGVYRGRGLGRNWTRSCADEIEAIFQRDREEGSRRISERLARTEEWGNWNAAIDLAEAHVKGWLRQVLYDAAGQEPVIAELLAQTTMRSPERLMRKENMTLWRALRESSGRIVRLRHALKHPAIVEWLRNGYGHAGILRTKYLGVDPLPSVQVAADTREQMAGEQGRLPIKPLADSAGRVLAAMPAL